MLVAYKLLPITLKIQLELRVLNHFSFIQLDVCCARKTSDQNANENMLIWVELNKDLVRLVPGTGLVLLASSVSFGNSQVSESQTAHKNPFHG